jgi:hypothetical protein
VFYVRAVELCVGKLRRVRPFLLTNSAFSAPVRVSDIGWLVGWFIPVAPTWSIGHP